LPANLNQKVLFKFTTTCIIIYTKVQQLMTQSTAAECRYEQWRGLL